MRQPRQIKRVELVVPLVILLLLLILASFNAPWATASQQGTTIGNAPAFQELPAAGQKLFMPLIKRSACIPGSVPCPDLNAR